MKFKTENVAELNLLLQFNPASQQTGIKVRSDADAELQAAVKSLFEKNLCTLADGGYLTDEGIEASEHALKLLHVLSSKA
ncbi:MULTISPECIES: TIGR02647 family protein [Vibrio]|uniref:TIGR02647 family protein n=1 Tax=Vibrio algicola TaxID=2662262 RepID=A0A5Q0TD53_9VIBR|nr:MULTISPECIES: TIGR02647 family protein [Vibrio]MBD1576715.1 TIGR02647 family protein [Vibrio sp. S11_S32]